VTIMWSVVTFGFILSVILVPFWSLLGPFCQVLRSLKVLIFVNILVAALLMFRLAAGDLLSVVTVYQQFN